jgi:hypothetical protein
VDGLFHGRTGKSRLTRSDKTKLSPLRLDAPIVYRLGQEILILQSGVRFPVGAPLSAGFIGKAVAGCAAKTPFV